MTLLSAKTLRSFSGTPEEKWLSIFEALEDRLDDLEDADHSLNPRDYLEYVHVIQTTADALGISGIPAFDFRDPDESFTLFRASVVARATALIVSRDIYSDKDRLVLSETVQNKVLEHTSALRILANDSNLPPKRRAKLFALLSELEESFEFGAISLSESLRKLAVLGVLVAEATNFAANAPTAISNIIQLIGHQVDAEETRSENLLLPADPNVPMLPAPPLQIGGPETMTGED